MKLNVVAAMGLLFMVMALLQFSDGQSLDSSPAPAPTSDGTAVDQGIAYVLLLLALANTCHEHYVEIAVVKFNSGKKWKESFSVTTAGSWLWEDRHSVLNDGIWKKKR
ncbi:hypothetical protein V6N13_118773 [Hibiscus sabdariffa]|uniref:Uncharacterized protein n=1 Tax=Hibiscus sabdariffa TaxID=183260 RepID=A0ABR2E0G7_9ROSI